MKHINVVPLARIARIVVTSWFICASCAAASPAHEQGTAKSATIDSIVTEVLAHNPELEFYEAEMAAAKGEKKTAGTWSNPELSGTLGSKRTSGDGASGDGLAWSVSVQQTFEWPGRIELRKAIADRRMVLAELGLAQFRSALEAKTRALAYRLRAAQEKAKAIREVSARFQSLRETLVQREPAGLTPLLETRIIEATELTTQRKATEAEIAAEAAMLELNQLRGTPWQNGVAVEPTALAFTDVPKLDVLLDSAEKNNFELKMRKLELDQQGLQVSLAKNERYPSMKVGPYYSKAHATDDEEQFGLGIAVPLPVLDQNEGKVATEKARQVQTSTSMNVAKRTVEREIVASLHVYEAKLREMGQWKPESVIEFRKAAALADQHFRLGAVPITTYVELQRQYLEAVEALLDTKAEALEAEQELERLTGAKLRAVELKTTQQND